MNNLSSTILPASLARAQQRFEQWRSEQPKRSRLPEDLWALAVDMGRQFGISRTAKALRLDHHKLKAKSQASQAQVSESMAFLELQPQRGSVACTLDIQRSADLQTIRMVLSGPEWPDLSGLLQGLWRS
jgi:hypothetical protein